VRCLDPILVMVGAGYSKWWGLREAELKRQPPTSKGPQDGELYPVPQYSLVKLMAESLQSATLLR
jgi:hypothetical protein